MLTGFAFFSHQVGGFLGVWLGGIAFVSTGSYDAVWWLSILFGVLSAVINLPIVEKPVRAALPSGLKPAPARMIEKIVHEHPQPPMSIPSASLAHARRHPRVRLPDLIGFGPRSARLFPHPDDERNGWGRDVFALAVAMQMLI